MSGPSGWPAAAPARANDGLGELANVGAGHAAGVLAALVGRTLGMRPPRAGSFEGTGPTPAAAPRPGWVRFDFRLSGGPFAALEVRLAPPCERALLDALLPGSPLRQPGLAGAGWRVRERIASALAESANLIASAAVSAVADLLATAILPGTPASAPPDPPSGPCVVTALAPWPDGPVLAELVWTPGGAAGRGADGGAAAGV